MSESELNAHFAEMDERPMYRKGGAVNFMGTGPSFAPAVTRCATTCQSQPSDAGSLPLSG
jgi:hypothetical protein